MVNNTADISLFEQIQSDQHNRTHINSMSVFNTPEDVRTLKKAAKDLTAILDKANSIYTKQEKLKQELKKLDTEWETIHPKIDTAIKTYDNISESIETQRNQEFAQIEKMEKTKREKENKRYTKEQTALNEIRQNIKKKREPF